MRTFFLLCRSWKKQTPTKRGSPLAFRHGRYFSNAEASVIVWQAHDRVAQLDTLIWGMRPWRERDDQGRKIMPIINTRVEKLKERYWRADFEERRCLVPATRFAEWTGKPGSKREVFFAARGGTELELFAIAGVWRKQRMRLKEMQQIERTYFSLATTRPNEVVEPYHNRMPLVLMPEDYDSWLKGAPDEAYDLATALPPGENFLRVLNP